MMKRKRGDRTTVLEREAEKKELEFITGSEMSFIFK